MSSKIMKLPSITQGHELQAQYHLTKTQEVLVTPLSKCHIVDYCHNYAFELEDYSVQLLSFGPIYVFFYGSAVDTHVTLPL